MGTAEEAGWNWVIERAAGSPEQEAIVGFSPS
jgi:hypothetical protein